MRVSIEIQGAAELDRKLRLLPLKVAQRVVRQAVRNAQKVMLNAVRTLTLALPISAKRGGAMKALIARAWQIRVPKKGQRPGSYALHVQIAPLPEFVHASPRTGKTTWIPAAIEYGHGADADKAARPFARPAADMTAPLVQAVLAHDLGKGIERAAMERA